MRPRKCVYQDRFSTSFPRCRIAYAQGCRIDMARYSFEPDNSDSSQQRCIAIRNHAQTWTTPRLVMRNQNSNVMHHADSIARDSLALGVRLLGTDRLLKKGD